MNEKTLSLDLLEKGANLCRFLSAEKGESLVSQRLFGAICSLCECCYSFKNPSLAKNEALLLRKNAALELDKAMLYLDSLCASGYISSAQKESMAKTLETLKKETNI